MRSTLPTLASGKLQSDCRAFVLKRSSKQLLRRSRERETMVFSIETRKPSSLRAACKAQLCDANRGWPIDRSLLVRDAHSKRRAKLRKSRRVKFKNLKVPRRRRAYPSQEDQPKLSVLRAHRALEKRWLSAYFCKQERKTLRPGILPFMPPSAWRPRLKTTLLA